MNLKSTLEQIYAGQRLNSTEAQRLLESILDDEPANAQVAALLSAFRMRPLVADELRGFREALRLRASALDFAEYQAIDLCGSGGDGKESFNISTTAAFVVAGAGTKVAKHGNYAASSKCGSSNVLEALGIRLTNDPVLLRAQLEQANICFLHAPLFHPALKKLAPVRKELQVRTVLNLLGPLLNPCSLAGQLIGCASAEIAAVYAAILRQEHTPFCLAHALDGYDELSLTADALLIERDRQYELSAKDFGLEALDPAHLLGGQDAAQAAQIVLSILEQRAAPAKLLVTQANAALALRVRQPTLSLLEAFQMAKESLHSGKALQVLTKCLELQERYS
jgi:anthranilate phosphoribosyltransferase